jgi:hypothetical protein
MEVGLWQKGFQMKREIGKKIGVEQKDKEKGNGNKEKMKDYKLFSVEVGLCLVRWTSYNIG